MDEQELRELWDEQLKNGGPIQHWDEWRDVVSQAYTELIRRARELPYDEMPITYGGLGLIIGLSIGSDWFHLKIAHILDACSKYESRHGRPLISALVVNKDTGRPGKGFWGLGGIPPQWRKVTQIEDFTSLAVDRGRDEYWVQEIRRIDVEWKATG